jgi:hypothetical protein
MFYLYTVQKDFRDIEDLPLNFIIHCHHSRAIPIFSQNRKSIIITRNPIEIVISHMIAQETSTYHFGKLGESNLSVEKYKEKYNGVQFKFSEKYFITWLKEILEWYVNAYQFANDSIVIKYEQAINIKEFSRILDLQSIETPDNLPVAQPFDKWKIVQNSDKFKEIGNIIFQHYKEKYPDIFTEENFRY